MESNIFALRIPRQSRRDNYLRSIQQRRETIKLSSAVFFSICFLLCISYYKLLWIDYSMSQAVHDLGNKSVDKKFIASNALKFVKKLSKLGPRPVGSFENEVLAINIISRELTIIADRANKVHKISIDFQKVSGSFSLTGMTSVYRNIQNVILKIGPHSNKQNSVLLNCHYDSVPDSPGGSDNSAGCGVMLELLRIVSITSKPLENNIIFLFNGAEENFLQGSHGFITQHKWAKDIKAFINLEAYGSGGRELLLQVGPENPWLMEVYCESVVSPQASTIAQEIFQSRLILGDTDYRIFRDFGQIPGFDFAWTMNGYIYHTNLDNAENVPMNSLQRTGDNLLPLMTRLASINFVDAGPKRGNIVFFDILGVFMFRTREISSYLIAIIAILLSLLVLLKNSFNFIYILPEYSRSMYFSHLIFVTSTTIFSWLLACLYVSFYSQIIILLDRSMSWYASPIWTLFLYGVPAIYIPAKITEISMNHHEKVLKSNWVAFSLHIDAIQMIWSAVLIFSILMKIRSSIIISMYLLFHTFGNLLLGKIRLLDRTGRGVSCIMAYAIVAYIPFLQISYFMNSAMLIIIPTMGRTGAGHNTEGLMALLSTLMFLILFNSLVPIFCLFINLKKALRFLIRVSVITTLVLILTPLGFPYSSEQNSPAPQRYMILHVEQIVHQYDGRISSDRGGFWIVNLDVNSPSSVSRMIPEVGIAQKVNSCETLLYCGLPVSIPVQSLIRKTHWIDTQKPVISIPTELKLMNIEILDGKIRRYHFSSIGPDHMTIVISPIDKVEILRWSLINETPLSGPSWNRRKTYFIYYSYGSDPVPFNFTIDLKVEAVTSDSVLDIALTGHFLHGAHQRSAQLKKLLSKFPKWTVTSGWNSIYKSYKF